MSDIISLTLGLIVAVFVGSAAGYVGSIMVSKRMALVGDALSHVALPGLAHPGYCLTLTLLLERSYFWQVSSVCHMVSSKVTNLSVEAIIGVLFVLALAIGILITPASRVWDWRYCLG